MKHKLNRILNNLFIIEMEFMRLFSFQEEEFIQQMVDQFSKIFLSMNAKSEIFDLNIILIIQAKDLCFLKD